MYLNGQQQPQGKRVCVIGLGYIGLPTACILVHHGYDVVGVDIDPAVLRRIQAGDLFPAEPAFHDLLRDALANHRFTLSQDVVAADIFLIAVPTPLGPQAQPDLSCVEHALSNVLPHLTAGNLVILESTCPIGTTSRLAKRVRAVCANIHMAYCPERALPGQLIHELLHNDRIVGGIDPESTTAAQAFYQSFIAGKIFRTDDKTAEAIKLAENTYRDINIAYANELSRIAEHCGLNVHDIIRLANQHPRVNILQPGIGVGGHCIAVDPYFLAACAPGLTPLIANARAVNQQKTEHVLHKIVDLAKLKGVRSIACLGLAYKPNVSDVRNSPALEIVQKLRQEFKVFAVDPHVPHSDPMEEALTQADMMVILVAHEAFIDIAKKIPPRTLMMDWTHRT